MYFVYQGGAVALRTALTSGVRFGGCVGLSCYLPGDVDDISLPDQPIQTPIFQVRFKLYDLSNLKELCLLFFLEDII